MRTIPSTGKVYNETDKMAIQEWLDSGEEMTYGSYYKKFEEELSKYIGVRHAFFVNSGSSANLIAFATMYEKYGLRPGDEIITVAATFPTTVSPIVQYGCTPVFVDIDIDTLNINVGKMEELYSPNVKGIILAHALGNPFELDKVLDFCIDHNLFLIEDCADAFGSKYQGINVGSFGDISTTSFYPAHGINTGGGGAVFTNNDDTAKLIHSYRNWGRDSCICEPNQNNICGKRFNGKHGDLPYGYDHKMVFGRFGYNLMATNPQAALGLSQLKRICAFISQRKLNFNYLKSRILNSSWKDKVKLIAWEEKADPVPFCFPILCELGTRDRLNKHLLSHGVDTRYYFAGNITRQPMFEYTTYFRDELINTDRVMNDLLYVGCYHGLNVIDMEIIFHALDSFYTGEI